MVAQIDNEACPNEITFTGEDILAIFDHPAGMLFSVNTDDGPVEVLISIAKIKEVLMGATFFGNNLTGTFRVQIAQHIDKPF